jgi:hypothetical protein
MSPARDALATGEIETVLSEDGDLADALAQLLAFPKPDPAALSQSLRNRFGRPAFRAQLGMALRRLLERSSIQHRYT